MHNKLKTDLISGNIKSTLKSLAIPSSIAFLFQTLYNITDTYFAGFISTEALAAMSISFPIYFLLLSVGIGMSEAITSIIANALGEENKAKAQNIAQNALFFAFILSIIITIIGLLSSEFLMRYLGASGSYLQSALDYINVIIYGSILFIMSMFLNSLLNAQGDMTSFRNALIVTFFINIGLDYLAIKWGFGIKGISIATLITEFIIILYLGYKLYKTKLLHTKFYLNISVYKKLLEQGFAPTASMIFFSLGIFIMTYYVSFYGESVIAALGVGMKIQQLAIMPIIGIGVAVLTIVAQNNGARKFERVEETMKVALLYSAYIAISSFIVFIVFPGYLISFFTNDSEVIKEGIIFLRIEAFLIFAVAVISSSISLLIAIQKTKIIFYYSITRQIIFPILLLEIITLYTQDIIYVWLSIALSTILSAFIIYLYAMKKVKELKA